MQVVVNGTVCTIEWTRYGNGQTAMQLWAEDGPYARATVAVDGVDLVDGEVLIKDHSENAGMLEALEAAGIVERTGRYVRSGFVQIPVARLLVTPEA